MFQVKRVIIGVEMPAERPWDVSGLKPPSQLAVREGFQLAVGGRISVTLASILPNASPGWFGSPADAARQAVQDRAAAENVLEQLRQQHAASGISPRQCNCVVRTGDAWEELIRLGGNRPDSLIVCGTRDLGSLRRVLFGSTGLKLLRLAPGPVWIVKPTPIENDTTDIVACTDLGPVGSDVIQTAVSMAAINSARVHIVHAAEPGADTIELTDRVHAQLAATDYRTLQAGVKVNVPVGDADQCILECVEQCHADLVILGTSSKTGTSGLLPGSTVERLLPELKCSVLALKPEGFHSVLPPEFWTMQRVNEA
jgi:universal stress protein E